MYETVAEARTYHLLIILIILSFFFFFFSRFIDFCTISCSTNCALPCKITGTLPIPDVRTPSSADLINHPDSAWRCIKTTSQGQQSYNNRQPGSNDLNVYRMATVSLQEPGLVVGLFLGAPLLLFLYILYYAISLHTTSVEGVRVPRGNFWLLPLLGESISALTVPPKQFIDRQTRKYATVFDDSRICRNNTSLLIVHLSMTSVMPLRQTVHRFPGRVDSTRRSI